MDQRIVDALAKAEHVVNSGVCKVLGHVPRTEWQVMGLPRAVCMRCHRVWQAGSEA